MTEILTKTGRVGGALTPQSSGEPAGTAPRTGPSSAVVTAPALNFRFRSRTYFLHLPPGRNFHGADRGCSYRIAVFPLDPQINLFLLNEHVADFLFMSSIFGARRDPEKTPPIAPGLGSNQVWRPVQAHLSSLFSPQLGSQRVSVLLDPSFCLLCSEALQALFGFCLEFSGGFCVFFFFSVQGLV